MGWENRNGRQYYYRKKRRPGGRVVSEYAGAGALGELMCLADEIEREQQKKRRQADRQEMQRWLRLDEQIEEALELCKNLTHAAFLLAGFHTHKGQWRRTHGSK